MENNKVDKLDFYFVFSRLPEDAEITEFRYMDYKDLEKPKEEWKTRKIKVRDFLIDLADLHPEIWQCQTPKQVIEKLENIALSADRHLDSGPMRETEYVLTLAMRESTYQLIELYKNPHSC